MAAEVKGGSTRRPHRRPPSHRPVGPPRDHLDGVDVFDYYLKERMVRACSHRTRTSTAERRPNAPLITPSRPRLALQLSADRLLRTLWLCLPVRSCRHLLWLWRRQHRRSRRMRLGTA